MSQAMLEGLYTKLTAGPTALSTALGARIRHDQGEQNIDLPYLSFFPVDGAPTLGMNGEKTLKMRVQFDLWGNRSAGWEALGDIEQLLYDLLEGVSITATGFDRGVCRFVNRNSRSVEEDALRIIDEITIEGTDF
jgi:Protein of unknown function (DUF3168)